MARAKLAFQPDAERYYAEGYWRDGDLWSDFAARAQEHPDRVALVLDDRASRYAELRRAAVGVSHRLADAGVKPGEVVILLGRHSIEAAVAMLGCLHRGVVLAPLPPMFNETQLAALLEQTRRDRARDLRRREGDRQVPRGRRPGVAPARGRARRTSTRSRPSDPATSTRPRHADDLAMVLHSSGTTSAPKGIAHSSNTLRYATEGVCKRWGLTGDDVYLTVSSSASSAASSSATCRRCSTAPPASS